MCTGLTRQEFHQFETRTENSPLLSSSLQDQFNLHKCLIWVIIMPIWCHFKVRDISISARSPLMRMRLARKNVPQHDLLLSSVKGKTKKIE